MEVCQLILLARQGGGEMHMPKQAKKKKFVKKFQPEELQHLPLKHSRLKNALSKQEAIEYTRVMHSGLKGTDDYLVKKLIISDMADGYGVFLVDR